MKYQSYTKDRLEEAVRNSTTMVGVMKYLGVRTIGGGSWQHVRNKIKSFGICVDHFVSGKLGKTPPNKRSSDAVLGRCTRRVKSHLLRNALIGSGVKHECAICGQLPIWMNKPLVLDVDHIDNDWANNDLDNIRFLCPNCHSQRGKRSDNKLRVR